MNNRFLVQLLTSRRNYDVAEILHGKEMLSYLVTDFYRTFLSKYIKRYFRYIDLCITRIIIIYP